MTRRKLFVIIAIVTIIVLTIVITVVLLATRGGDLRVKRLMDGAVPKVSDFGNSRLRLNDNGTFEIEVIMYEDTRIFAGIGTWTREGNTYSFYYLDAHTTRDGEGADANAPDAEYVFKAYTYQIEGRTGWIVFFDHLGDPYYFG